MSASRGKADIDCEGQGCLLMTHSGHAFRPPPMSAFEGTADLAMPCVVATTLNLTKGTCSVGRW
jgi:hypothetical protein